MSTGSSNRKGKKAIAGEEYLARRKGSAVWQIQFTIGSYRVRESSGTESREAAARVATLRFDEVWRAVKLGEQPARSMDMNEASIRYYDEVAKGTSYGEQSQKRHLQTIIDILGARTELADLDDNTVNDLVQALRRRRRVPHNRPDGIIPATPDPLLSPATVNRHVTTLQSLCTRARKVWKVPVGTWEASDHKLKEAAGREVFLSHEQARAMIHAAIPHARPIFMLALATGLRKANVHDLQWENVSLDLARGVLLVKGGKPFSFDLPPLAVDMLARLQPDPAKRKGAVFWFGNPAAGCECATCKAKARHGEPIGSTRRAFATAARTAGVAVTDVGKLRFHDFRHSFASWVLESSGNLIAVRDALGHSNVSTSQRYSHLLTESKRRIVFAATAALEGPTVHPGDKKTGTL